MILAGCAAATTSTSPAPTPSSPGAAAIAVSVTPSSGAVLPGNTITFAATVSNSSNSAVIWSVSGIPGGNATQGTISPDGVYTAPAILQSPATISIQAVSVADSTKAATATITLLSDVTLTLSPSIPAIELGAQQAFQANVVSAGRPSSAIQWSLSGPGCSGLACGTVDATGVVTAPRVLPSPSSEVVTATSVADPSKKAAGIFNVASSFSFLLAGPAAVFTSGSADYVSTLIPLPSSNPGTTITWSLSGIGCAGVACGSLSVSNTGVSATYTAPVVAPLPGTVRITATPLADPSKAMTLEVSVEEPVTLSPASSTRAINHRQRFVASVLNSSSNAVNWFVNGIAGGNSSVGQVCAADSNPCQPVLSATAGEVDYLAPAAVPVPNPVTVTIVSIADPSKSASSPVTILPHLVVSVSPPSATVAPSAARLFRADVAGTPDQSVIWQIPDSACAGLGDPCGVVNPAGVYTAPAAVPSPNTVSITATSSEDTSRTGSASVTIAAEPIITSLRPSSLTAGAAGGTTLRVEGGNFAATSPGPGSLIRIAGIPRATLCDSVAVCSTTLAGADLLSAGNISIAVQNPNGALSAPATLMVTDATSGEDTIRLTPSAPDATGKDIVVVDLSTSGSSLPADNVNLNILSISAFQPVTGTCTIGGGPVTLVRPASGTATVHLCASSVSGLDPSLVYTFSGPTSNDIAIVGKEPLGLGIVHLTLIVPSAAQTGARTLFSENSNHDVTAASGVLDVR